MCDQPPWPQAGCREQRCVVLAAVDMPGIAHRRPSEAGGGVDCGPCALQPQTAQSATQVRCLHCWNDFWMGGNRHWHRAAGQLNQLAWHSIRGCGGFGGDQPPEALACCPPPCLAPTSRGSGPQARVCRATGVRKKRGGWRGPARRPGSQWVPGVGRGGPALHALARNRLPGALDDLRNGKGQGNEAAAVPTAWRRGGWSARS